jgi:hypothetical protein
MEYFAARFIYCDAKENQDVILSEIYYSNDISKYINMLDLYYDIDPMGFSKNITLPFCESFLEFYNSIKLPSNINKDLVNQRLSNLFWAKFVFALSSRKNEFKIVKLFEQTEFIHHFIRGKGRAKDEFVFFGYLFHNKYMNLIRLFEMKNLKIFSRLIFEYKSGFENWSYIITDRFEKNKAFFINVKTGDDNDMTYAAINDMVHPKTMQILDYQACEKEVERIRNEIAKMKKFSKFPKHL